MGKPKKPRRVETPLTRRQAILDELNAHGPQTMRQISEALQYEQRTVGNYMRELRGNKEVRVSGNERSGKCLVPIYAATVTTAKELCQKIVVEPETQSNVTKTIAPGHIRHKGTHRDHPLKDSGGQGRLGGGSGVISSLGGGPLFIKL